MSIRLYFFMSLMSACLLYYTPNAGAQSLSYNFASNQNDFVLMKVCLPNSSHANYQYTPVQCTSDVGTLYDVTSDVTSTDLVTYIHADYPAAAASNLPIVGSSTIPLGTCRSYFGNEWIYGFPLSSAGSVHLNGTDSAGTRYPLYVHWIAAALHEYTANAVTSTQAQIDCRLSANKEYAYDSFGILTEFSYSSTNYMTLLGEDLPCSYGATDDSTSSAACITTYATPVTVCTTWSSCPRQYGWSIGNAYNSTAWGITSFDNAWATDLSLASSMPSFNTISLGKESYYYNQNFDDCATGASGYGCSLPVASTATQVANGIPLFGDSNVSNFPGIHVDPEVSFSVYSNFTFGPAGDYYTTNTQFKYTSSTGVVHNNVNPQTGATLNPNLASLLQFGYVHLYNGDAPAPYTGPSSTAAGESEHIYSTQLYGYATRWELWHEVDVAPMAIADAAAVYAGKTCSHPENPYASTGGTVNSDFNYGDPTAVLVPVALDDSGNVVSQPGANVTAGGAPTTVPSNIFVGGATMTTPNTVNNSGTYNYANSSVIITDQGIFAFGTTPTDPTHYPVYIWAANTTDFSDPATSASATPTNHGGAILAVGSDNKVYLEAVSGAITNWYQWAPNASWTPGSSSAPGSWNLVTGYPAPAQNTVMNNFTLAWEEQMTVGPVANPNPNIWYMVGCNDYTNAWNANDIAKVVYASSMNPTANATYWEEQLPNYPGTTGLGNNDFAHVIGSNYLTYFGVPPF